ncbi:hypothetical protein HY57_05190 [Dyella japonica A8]|uniref:Uncharacterized protein n=2 Tax=Dyella japonica TaxID=231455 RepID=A0A075JXV2_9GAMM|nr:hypothetical protein HY57_05190 [Dyella japonica A8]
MALHGAFLLCAAALVFSPPVEAARGGRGGGNYQPRASSRSSINAPARNNTGNRNFNNSNVNNRNVNRNTNINQNVNVNRNVNVDVDNGWDHRGWNDHPVATAAAVTATVAVTAAVVGSVVHSVPPNCQTVVTNGVTYSQCGNTWYQPSYAGSQVQYVVVNPPY